MLAGTPTELLTEALYATADAIRGFPSGQQHVADTLAPSQPPQPIITVLLLSALNDRQALSVRAAALYCFQCYLAANREAQADVVASLLPRSEQGESVSRMLFHLVVTVAFIGSPLSPPNMSGGDCQRGGFGPKVDCVRQPFSSITLSIYSPSLDYVNSGRNLLCVRAHSSLYTST